MLSNYTKQDTVSAKATQVANHRSRPDARTLNATNKEGAKRDSEPSKY